MARNPSGSAGMAPRQRAPQAWQPPALGVPAYAHFAESPQVLSPRPSLGGSHGRGFGGGSVTQAVRNVFQQIRQFPQQLQQLAQAASHHPPITMQHAMHTAQMAIHGLQTLSQPTPYMHPPMPYAPPHAPAFGPQQPVHGMPLNAPPPPAWGVPVGSLPPQPAAWHQPAPPMAMHPALQVQHAARQFVAQAQAFDAAMLSQQVQQMHMNAQTVRNCMAELQQVFLANQALLAAPTRPGQTAARAMM